MWLTAVDQFQWSYYLTNAVAIVLNAVIVVALLRRLWLTRNIEDSYTLLRRMAKGVLIISASYQVILSISRLGHFNLPIEFRDTWVMKDIGIFLYVISVGLLHRKIMSGKVGDYSNAKRDAQVRSMEVAMQVGQTNHDERVRNEPRSNHFRKEP